MRLPEQQPSPDTRPDREAKTRQELVDRWKHATYEDVLRYPKGKAIDSSGLTYEYQAGARLIILGEEVMDSCQIPWATATVDKAFDALRMSNINEPVKNVKVLERGFGMGIVATRIMEHLRITGGSYTAIELNEQVAEHAERDWKEKQKAMARAKAASPIGGSYRNATEIDMNIIRGEAFEETAKLVRENKKFDIIISDTFPLSDEEKSVNDLLDLEQLIQCLSPDGVFAFFGYHTGSDGTLNEKQRSIYKYFINVNTTQVEVNPPPDYKYFNPPSGTVRRLPVIICTQLIH